ncbi:prenyltransferase/squalene oxidase repeat-containing protein [Glycomyces buryatensis]|uniref:Terpene cyclase/mutase family protein n=1 Tax=Glycomyces buryatensis TaxID=2570927 RepID=A0A4S8QJM0_9ACTN|nr:prenyltransferase/squalene oxidase repeat-containing protein [Glycomyces buryatensis]THV41589.1 hypothetical protein FAB82_10830 [Glycomyces buryatensis]
MRHQPKRRLLTAAAAAVLPIAVLGTAAAPAHAQDSEPFAAPAAAGAAWLAAQADGPSWSDGDIGTSLDAVIGLMAARVGTDQVQTTLEWLNDEDVLSSYVYPPSDESEDPALNAGGAGKVMYVVATAGGDPTDFGGIRLAAEVTAAQTETGGFGDGSVQNTSWAVLGLSRTDQGANAEAGAALAAAQCDDGGFSYADVDADGGADCVSDPDTTGIAVAALAVLEGDDVTAALDGAVMWLENNQSENGGFDAGFGENASSTAMAAQAFFATERSGAAERATSFLIELQLGCDTDAAGAFMASDPEDPEYGESMRLLATAQSLVAVAGQNLATLDASESTADIPVLDCEGGTDAASPADEAVSSDSDAWIPWVIVAAALLLIALVAYLIVRARRGGDGGAEGAAEGGAASDAADADETGETGESEDGSAGEGGDGSDRDQRG